MQDPKEGLESYIVLLRAAKNVVERGKGGFHLSLSSECYSEEGTASLASGSAAADVNSSGVPW